MRKFLLFTLVMFLNLSNPAMSGVNVIGKPVKLIGGDGEYFMQPRWSPDGSLIAFTESNYHGIWVMKPNGSDVQQISDEPAAGFGFEWSADSRAIVSRVANYKGRYRYNAIKVFDLEKNAARLLSDYRTMMPALPHWAEADEKVYLFCRGKLEIFESGKKATALQKQNANQMICFLKDDQIAIGNIETKEYHVFDRIKDWQILNLIVSPDQTKIAFEVYGGNMYVMNIDGTDLTDLGEGHRPQWAPDSESLVYMITQDDGHRITASDIYTIKIDGNEKVNLTNTDDRLEMNPSWSPDGNKIIFDMMDEGAIYLVEISKEKIINYK